MMHTRPPTFEGEDGFSRLLRHLRGARRMSQLDLALDCNVSARHLSFLETGRAKPSREMVLQVSAGLVLPLASQNALLQAAGFAPMFPTTPLDSEALGPFRVVLQEMIDRHAPWPAILADRHWRVRDANDAALALLAPLQEDGETSHIRMLTGSATAPDLIANLPEGRAEMRGRIALEALEAPGDEELVNLIAELDDALARHPPVAATRRPLVPLEVRTSGGVLKFLSTVAHFGTSEDVTVRDLRLELLFPADDLTRSALRPGAAD